MPYILEDRGATERSPPNLDVDTTYSNDQNDRPSSVERYHIQVMHEHRRMLCFSPEYDRKQVYQIQCKDCEQVLTNRGMNAVLLSDRSVQLFSTDLRPHTVGFVYGDYCAASCQCRVRDTACLNCGNVVGYHVNLPCKNCLTNENNGHYWMFRSDSVKGYNIYMLLGQARNELPLLWGFLSKPENYSSQSSFYTDHDGINTAYYDENTATALSGQLAIQVGSSVPLVVLQPRFETVQPVQTSQMEIRDGFEYDRSLMIGSTSTNQVDHVVQFCR